MIAFGFVFLEEDEEEGGGKEEGDHARSLLQKAGGLTEFVGTGKELC
jgi:hypothetical protein